MLSKYKNKLRRFHIPATISEDEELKWEKQREKEELISRMAKSNPSELMNLVYSSGEKKSIHTNYDYDTPRRDSVIIDDLYNRVDPKKANNYLNNISTKHYSSIYSNISSKNPSNDYTIIANKNIAGYKRKSKHYKSKHYKSKHKRYKNTNRKNNRQFRRTIRRLTKKTKKHVI